MKKIAIIARANQVEKDNTTSELINQLLNKKDGNHVFHQYISYSGSQRSENHYFTRLMRKPVSIANQVATILEAAAKSDVLIVLNNNCAWLFPLIRLFTRKKIITNLHADISDKYTNQFSEKYKEWMERLTLSLTHMDISNTESSQRAKFEKHGYLSRIIETGGDHVEYVETTEEDHRKFIFLKYQYALSVNLSVPGNTTRMILEAYKDYCNKNLVIISNWNGSSYGKKLRKEFSCLKNIFMLDVVNNKREMDLIRSNSILYIHEANGFTEQSLLIEAMSHGLPVLSFDNILNKEVTEKKAAYFFSTEQIRIQLKLLNMEKLRHNSIQMHQIAERSHKWAGILNRYSIIIDEVHTKKLKTKSVFKSLDYEILLKHQAGHLQYSYSFGKTYL